jgi:hypothetical protein
MEQAESLAVDVDRRLVLADGQPRGLRNGAVASLEPEVAQVEEACGRLVDTIKTWAAAAPGRSAQDLMERIGAIDAALGEVNAAEETPALPSPAVAEVLTPRQERARRLR